MLYKKVFLIVLDSLGIGNCIDQKDFGDEGACTLGHIIEKVPNIKMPNLDKLGLVDLLGVDASRPFFGYHLPLSELSKSKDTMAGHWEMMGVETKTPFKTFTEKGFPMELIKELEKRTGHKVIGNKAASGTVILDELGEEEISTAPNSHMIVYTSADSVLQICGNEETFGLDELYRCSTIARELTMRDEWKVGRVIARPYIGKKKGEFVRTANRKDYALAPPIDTDLDILKNAGFSTIGVGKISDIFNKKGITESIHSTSSVEGMQQTIELLDRDFIGLVFTNLVDFDAKWGHRRNVEGYAQEIEKFDVLLARFLEKMQENTLLMITADHGNDPTYKGTDHTREKVPLLIYSKVMEGSGVLQEEPTFGCIGATILDNFGLCFSAPLVGTSLLHKMV